MSYGFADLLENLKRINADTLKSVIKAENKIVVVFQIPLSIDIVLKNSVLKKRFLNLGFVPVFVSEETIIRSLDVYPLEYLDMKKKYEVLFGEDVFADIKILPENIRLETEQKFKGVEIRLNQIIFEVGEKYKKILKVCFLALEDLFIGMEGLLTLKNKSISEDKLEIIEDAEEIVGFSLVSLKEVFKLKNEKEVNRDIKSVVSDFHKTVMSLSEFVDKMDI